MRRAGRAWAGAAAALSLRPDEVMAHITVLPVTPDDVWQAWAFDWWIVLPILLAHWLYGRGLVRLWSSAGVGRGISLRQAGFFLAGEALLVAALVSPLDALGSTLQSAHMAQHAILIAFAPPLLLLGRPDAALAWAIGPRAALRIGRLRMRFAGLAGPFAATALHAAAIWLWHVPALYEAALASEALHWLEHASFFGTALLFWSVALRGARHLHAAPAAMAASLATVIHSGFLAAILTFAPVLLYPWYDGRAQLWGLTPLEDQQLSGLLMWVPVTPVYLAACLFAAWALINRQPVAQATMAQPSPRPFARRAPPA